MKKFWKLTNSVDSSGSTLYLDGPIASETWWGDEVTPQAFRDELKEITSKNLTVIIDSVGGDIWAGMSIYNALRELDAEVTVRVDGLAASIASVIAMSGNEIVMSPGSMMMIHRASAFAGGNAKDLEKTIEMLETAEKSIVPIYSDRTGLSADRVEEMMEAETWMSAEEAVELGFADKVAETVKKSGALENAKNLLTGKEMQLVMQANEESIKSLASKVEAKEDEEDSEEESEEETPTVVTTEKDGETVTEVTSQEPPKKVVVETETDEDAGESDEEQVNKPANKETKTMSDTQAIAKDQVVEPKNQAPVVPKVEMKAYLKSKDSIEAFAKILEQNAGKTSQDVKMAWKDHLEVKMGVTNPEIFLPEALITSIEDAFKEGGEIWNRVSKTGADVFRAAWDTEDDVSSEDGRGRGYNRDEAEEKAEQVLTIADRILRPQFVYKYITLNKEDVKNQRTTGALVTYVLGELPRRIVREVERAIVIGDGRAPGSDYKIQEGSPEGFYPIKNDADEGNVFASVYVPAAGESRAESVAKARDLLEADGNVVLIAKKGYSTAARFEKDSDDRLLFPLGTRATDVFDVEAVIEPDWFTDATDPENDAYLVALSNYKIVGDTSVEAFTNFILKTNKQEYLQEIYAGGGLTVRSSAVAVSASTS